MDHGLHRGELRDEGRPRFHTLPFLDEPEHPTLQCVQLADLVLNRFVERADLALERVQITDRLRRFEARLELELARAQVVQRGAQASAPAPVTSRSANTRSAVARTRSTSSTTTSRSPTLAIPRIASPDIPRKSGGGAVTAPV